MDTVEEGALGPQVFLLPQSDNVRELQTYLLDTSCTGTDFEFYSQRLIRLVIETGLSHLKMRKKTVKTPLGDAFDGLELATEPVGVSIMRGGQAMEQGLRACLKSVATGHILIRHDEAAPANEPRLYYAHLPSRINSATILLLDAVLGSGATLLRALEVLISNGAPESNIVILNLFATRSGIESILKAHPKVHIVASGICVSGTAIDFSARYFGT